MEPRLIYVLIPVILIGKELQFIYCRSVTAPANSANHVTNSSNNVSSARNRISRNQTYLQFSDLPQSDDPYSLDYYYRSLFSGWIPPYQSLNVLTLESPPSSRCAAILTSSYYVLQMPDNGMQADISEIQFVLWTAKIEASCFLTIQDCAGAYITTNTSLPSTTRCNFPSSVCCECKGCERPSYPEYETSCAVLFEHIGCSKCNGFRLIVASGDEVQTMNELVDKKISSVYVSPECELLLYADTCFLGEASLATGSLNLPPDWNDVISSYKCTCGRNGDPNRTTESPPTTLPETTPVMGTTMRPTTGITTITSEITNMPTTLTLPTSTVPYHTTTEMMLTTVAATLPPSTTTTMQTTEPETTTLPTSTATKDPTTIKEITTIAYTTTVTTEKEGTTTRAIDTTTVREPTTVRDPTTLIDTTTTEPTTLKEVSTVKSVTTTAFYEVSTDHYNELY